MNTYAYDAGLPCKNPNCKSHGQPHPNCKCYSSDHNPEGYAEGGDVKSFCDSGMTHKPDCEYFAEGGDALPSFESLVPVSHDAPATQEAAAVPQQQVPTAAQAAMSSASSDALPAINELVPLDQHELPPLEDLVHTDHDKYSTTGQQILTGVEGLAQGFAGPLATLAEKGLSELGVPGLSNEEIAGRANENPWIHGISEAGGLAGGLLTGTGEAGLIAKGLEGVTVLNDMEKAGTLANIGSAAVKGFIQNGLIQAGDETSGYLLGQTKDPSAVASNILAAGALGSVVGAGTTGSAALLKKIPDLKAADHLLGLGVGVGAGLRSEEQQLAKPLNEVIKTLKASGHAKEYLEGMKVGDKLGKLLTNNIYGHGLALLQAEKGYQENGIVGAVGGAIKGELVGSALGYGITKVNAKYTIPMLFKALSTQTYKNIAAMLRAAPTIAEGASAIENGTKNLFEVGTQQGVNAWASDKDKQKLDEFIENGGVQRQIENQDSDEGSSLGFAEGGLVPDMNRSNVVNNKYNPSITGHKTIDSIKSPYQDSTNDQPLSKPVAEALNKPILDDNDPIPTHYPELGMVLAQAKGRINDYLKAQKPQANVPRLAFDSPPDQTKQKRSYDKALGIAVQPLSILNNIKEGTTTPEHIQHFSAMYPDLHEHLKKEVTKKIVDAQLKGQKPTYKVRQGLSMFMGTALDSTMTPSSIQAAQSVYNPGSAAQPPTNTPVTKNKKNTSTLSKTSEHYQTSTQASEARQRAGH